MASLPPRRKGEAGCTWGAVGVRASAGPKIRSGYEESSASTCSPTPLIIPLYHPATWLATPNRAAVAKGTRSSWSHGHGTRAGGGFGAGPILALEDGDAPGAPLDAGDAAWFQPTEDPDVQATHPRPAGSTGTSSWPSDVMGWGWSGWRGTGSGATGSRDGSPQRNVHTSSRVNEPRALAPARFPLDHSRNEKCLDGRGSDRSPITASRSPYESRPCHPGENRPNPAFARRNPHRAPGFGIQMRMWPYTTLGQKGSPPCPAGWNEFPETAKNLAIRSPPEAGSASSRRRPRNRFPRRSAGSRKLRGRVWTVNPDSPGESSALLAGCRSGSGYLA